MASVFGRGVAEDMDAIRTEMGYCPQHDTLFLGLTVEENMKVFAGLKGLTVDFGQCGTPDPSSPSAAQLLERLGLEEKRHSLAKTLSGGQKRALSVAIALVGNPRFLVLDEPTAGMDPAARRRVWDVLLEGKDSNSNSNQNQTQNGLAQQGGRGGRGRRVTLLTTHFLDEADVLGDRVGILAHGRLACLGTPLFLKRRLGVGYHLTVVADGTEAVCGSDLGSWQRRPPSSGYKRPCRLASL